MGDGGASVFVMVERCMYRFARSVPYGSLVGPVDPSLRSLSGRLKFTDQRHKSNKDYLSRSGTMRVRMVDGGSDRQHQDLLVTP